VNYNLEQSIELEPIPAQSVNDIIAEDVAPEESLLGDIFIFPSLNMISAGTGVGKSHVIKGFCRAIATGTMFLDYKAPKARRVLYIDGEMSKQEVKKRIVNLATPLPVSERKMFGVNCTVVNCAKFKNSHPDFTQNAWQNHFDALISDHDVIVFDNLVSLTGGTNLATDTESVNSFIYWCLRLRNQKNKAVFLINHVTKTTGESMGLPNLRLFNNVNVVLTKDKAFIEMEFVKIRHMFIENPIVRFLFRITEGVGIIFSKK